jgi:glutathione synthase
VYFRSGFETSEYGNGREARVRLEMSRAVKCPSILSHLTTFKKVQQALSVPGVLERFLSPEESVSIANTFAKLYSIDEDEARKLATGEESARGYVLKPSLEGGGHNVYGSSIPPFLARTPKGKWGNYILQRKIIPPQIQNLLMSPQGLYKGPVISELGVFGIYLWKGKEGVVEIVEEKEPCWSFKTKSADVDEMSVVKGYGCFDSPALVNLSDFMACCDEGEVESEG